jgi:proteasome assembly chaperone (PAC2) family protein
MHIAVNMSLECWDGANNAESMTGAVYSGNLSGVAETGNPIASWVKNFAGRQVVGLNGVDRTGDLVNDALMITTVTETDLGENLTVIFVNGSDGTSIVDLPAATYALTR